MRISKKASACQPDDPRPPGPPGAEPTAAAVDQDLIDFAVDAARRAGQITLDWYQQRRLAVTVKRDGSPVTEADIAAERFLRSEISAACPGDAIRGEEEGDWAGTTGRTWVIDPIDGTKAFTRGVPLYATLLALVDDRGPAVGVICLPALDECVWAGRGRGVHWDGAPCQVSDRDRLDGSYVCTSGLSYWPDRALGRVRLAGARIRTWGDAYGYAPRRHGPGRGHGRPGMLRLGRRPDVRDHHRGRRSILRHGREGRLAAGLGRGHQRTAARRPAGLLPIGREPDGARLSSAWSNRRSPTRHGGVTREREPLEAGGSEPPSRHCPQQSLGTGDRCQPGGARLNSAVDQVQSRGGGHDGRSHGRAALRAKHRHLAPAPPANPATPRAPRPLGPRDGGGASSSGGP